MGVWSSGKHISWCWRVQCRGDNSTLSVYFLKAELSNLFLWLMYFVAWLFLFCSLCIFLRGGGEERKKGIWGITCTLNENSWRIQFLFLIFIFVSVRYFLVFQPSGPIFPSMTCFSLTAQAWTFNLSLLQLYISWDVGLYVLIPVKTIEEIMIFSWNCTLILIMISLKPYPLLNPKSGFKIKVTDLHIPVDREELQRESGCPAVERGTLV